MVFQGVYFNLWYQVNYNSTKFVLTDDTTINTPAEKSPWIFSREIVYVEKANEYGMY